jgi:hypothetical protein
MKNCFILLGFVLTLLLAGYVGGDDVQTKKVHCTVAGSFTDGVETNIDTNNDNVSGGVIQGLSVCNTGRALVQAETEYAGPVTPNTTCPEGTEEFHAVQNHSVATDQKTADQTFGEAVSLTLCLDPTAPDLAFTYTGKINIVGGTGNSTGAAGSLDVQGSGKYLVFGFKNGVFGGFGQFSETDTGTLILPNH